MHLMQVCRQLYDLSSLTAVAFNFPTFPTDMTSMHRERISKGRIRWMVVRLYGFLWLEWSLLKSFIFGLVFFLLLVFHQLPVRTCPPIYPSVHSFIPSFGQRKKTCCGDLALLYYMSTRLLFLISADKVSSTNTDL